MTLIYIVLGILFLINTVSCFLGFNGELKMGKFQSLVLSILMVFPSAVILLSGLVVISTKIVLYLIDVLANTLFWFVCELAGTSSSEVTARYTISESKKAVENEKSGQ